MNRSFGIMLAGMLCTACVALTGCGQPGGKPQVQLPDQAKQALTKAYPDAKIEKVKLETEDGQKLYEVKMLQAGAKLEVTLAENGTITEIETPIAAADLPKLVADAVTKAAPEAKIAKATKIQSITDAKLVKFATPKIAYEVEVKLGEKEGELTIAADGTVTEPLKWEEDKKNEKGQKEEDDED